MLNLDAVRESLPYIQSGLWTTLQLTAILIPSAFVMGLIVGLIATSRSRLARMAAFIYIDFFRSFPPLVLIIFIFYALPLLGLRLPELPAFTLAMTLNGSGYFAEIIRAGISSIPKGQYEAGRSTGLSSLQTMTYIILPQGLRNVMLPLLSNCIELAKATSLASVVSIAELLRTARIAQGVMFDPTPLLLAALVYFIILWPCVRLTTMLDRRPLVHIA